MKGVKTVNLLFLCCAVVFLFTNAQRPSSRKLRNGFQWYLDNIADSAGIFVLDTLRFVDPDPGLFQVVTVTNGAPDRDEDLDTLNIYPHLIFWGKPKNEFTLFYNCEETKTQSGMKEWGCRDEMRGRFHFSRKTQIIAFDFYKEKAGVSSDDLDDQIIYATKKYRVASFSKTNLVLVKSPGN